MKNIRLLFLTITAFAAGLLSSCGPQEEYAPGPEVDGAQVYFPNDATTLFSIGDEVNSIDIPVKRVSTEGSLKVDLLVDMGDMSEADQNLFSGIPASITFQDGKTDASIAIPFDRTKLEDGKEYTIGFLLNDEENSTPYGLQSIYITITPWPWVKMGTGKYREDWIAGGFGLTPFEIDVTIHKHKTKAGIYMLEELYGWDFLTTAFDATQAELAKQFSYTPTNIQVDCSDPANVNIPQQLSGITESGNGYGGLVIMSDPEAPGTLVDGVITFPANGVLLGMTGDGKFYYGNTSGMFRILLPGAEAVDYSLSAVYDGMKVSADNEAASAVVNFAYGADVTGISYAFASGDISDNADSFIASVANGTAENIYSVADFVAGAGKVSVYAELEAGPYTLVALPKNKSGVLVEKEAAVVSFYFPGMGGSEIPDCDAAVTLHSVSGYPDAAEIASKYPDYSSLVYEITGTEFKKLRYYMNKTSIINTIESSGLTVEQVLNQYGRDFPAEVIGELNSTGKFWNIFTNLAANTSYTLIIQAENTYGKKAIVLSEPLSTTQIPYSGELVIGDYRMVCQPEGAEDAFENSMKLIPVMNSETEFYVENFGIEDGMQWHAVYDPAKLTLTLDGIQKGYEDDGNSFGKAYGYWDANQTQIYGVWSVVDMNAQQLDGTNPAVLKVDPSTKRLSALDVNILVPVFEASSGSMLGYGGYYTKGTAISLVESSPASVRPASATGLKATFFGSRKMESATAIYDGTVSASARVSALEVKTGRCEPLQKTGMRSFKGEAPVSPLGVL